MENNYGKLFLNDIKRLWENFGLAQKIGLILLIAATVIIATIFLIKSTEPNWSVLYSDLTEQDAAAVAQSLQKGGYPFKLSQDKTAVLVPAEYQEELRLYVAENDVIKDSNPGFELLDELQLGSTDFKNRMTKQRIFQGELTKTIEKLNGIKKARVQIAEPERSIFTDKDEIPSASVMLILEPGYNLKTSQVKAIKNLVAYAIPRLTPDKVFLTDQSGNSLSDEIQKNSTEIESYRTNLEKQTAKKIQEVLDKITGVGNSSVQVSAEIDFNTVRATVESYLPSEKNSGVLASSQSETEIYQNPNKLEEELSDEEQELEVNGDKKINYEKQRTATHYNVSKEIKQIVYAPGTIKRMTIGVAVNKILTEAEKEELKNLVSTVSGVNLERGDVVNISSIEFASNEEEVVQNEKMMKSIETQNQVEFWANKIISPFIFLVLGITALFIIRSIMQSYSPTSANEAEVEEETMSLKEELDNLIDIEPLLQLEAKTDPELDKMKTNLTETIMADPKESTELLMNYINYIEGS